jgi:hypothetical protein
MSKYSIIHNGGKTMIQDNETGMFFAGYDPMGGVEWREEITPDCILTQYEDADQIVLDLEAADEPEEDPAKKQYLFKVWIEDELCISIKTGKQIAEFYETDQIAGIYSNMEVWDVTGDPKRISLLDLVEPILENKRWMEQEYRDYCESERYGY